MIIRYCVLSVLLVLVTSQFVTRKGNSLYLNDTVFRFGGCNIYWLGLDENVGGVDYPTHFRVDDALLTAVEMGTTVIRAHTLGVSTGNKAGNNKTFEHHLNVFNHEALQYIDYAVYRASQLNIKFIVPLTDNYNYYHGGKHDFTDWRGISDQNQFYTNPQVISDFKNYITQLLNHENQYSGIQYKNDPTVLAWETGNEIHPPSSWTNEIAQFLKSLAPNHLVLDGNYGIDTGSLGFGSVDIYSDHFYPPNAGRLESDAKLVENANKVFIVGEYGWTNTNLDNWLTSLEKSTSSGDCYWSEFPHLDTHGFEQHNDGYSIHYPGDNSNMAAAVQSIRKHAFVRQGKPVPFNIIPPAPLITSLSQGSIAWRGSAGAGVYSVEYSSQGQGGPWTVICNKCANDNQTPWRSSSIQKGFYRVVGFNLDGKPGSYSPVQSLA